MRKYCLFLFCILSSHLGHAQIKNPEFKFLLDSLYNTQVPLITIDDFLSLNRQNLYVLDTREEQEFKVSHIKNSRNAGYFWFDMRTVYDIPYNATVVLYCSVGIRSEKIAEKLIAAGYKNVLNLYGGIFEWVNQGHPVYKKTGVQTSEIHIYNDSWARWVERGTKVK